MIAGNTALSACGVLEDPKALAALGLELGVLLGKDLLRPRRRDRLVGAYLLDLEARLVLVEVLAGKPGAAVVRPDEGLAARDVVQGVVALDVVAESA